MDAASVSNANDEEEDAEAELSDGEGADADADGDGVKEATPSAGDGDEVEVDCTRDASDNGSCCDGVACAVPVSVTVEIAAPLWLIGCGVTCVGITTTLPSVGVAATLAVLVEAVVGEGETTGTTAGALPCTGTEADMGDSVGDEAAIAVAAAGAITTLLAVFALSGTDVMASIIAAASTCCTIASFAATTAASASNAVSPSAVDSAVGVVEAAGPVPTPGTAVGADGTDVGGVVTVAGGCSVAVAVA